jgi:hypothetical protein
MGVLVWVWVSVGCGCVGACAGAGAFRSASAPSFLFSHIKIIRHTRTKHDHGGRFDNSYFTTMYDPNADPELLKLDTDLCLFGDEGFRPFAMKVRPVGRLGGC